MWCWPGVARGPDETSKGGRAFQDTGPNERGFPRDSATPRAVWLALAGFVGLGALVAVSGVAIAATSLGWFAGLAGERRLPALTTLGPVWATLQVVSGLAGWLAWRRAGATRAVRLWGWQLAADALWVPAVFGLKSLALGLLVIVPLLALTAVCLREFARIGRAPAILMVPYLIWALYAANLNASLWQPLGAWAR